MGTPKHSSEKAELDTRLRKFYLRTIICFESIHSHVPKRCSKIKPVLGLDKVPSARTLLEKFFKELAGHVMAYHNAPGFNILASTFPDIASGKAPLVEWRYVSIPVWLEIIEIS